MQQQQKCGNSQVTASSGAWQNDGKTLVRLLKLYYASETAKETCHCIYFFICLQEQLANRAAGSRAAVPVHTFLSALYVFLW